MIIGNGKTFIHSAYYKKGWIPSKDVLYTVSEVAELIKSNQAYIYD